MLINAYNNVVKSIISSQQNKGTRSEREQGRRGKTYKFVHAGIDRHYLPSLFVVDEISSPIERNNNYVHFSMWPWFRLQTKLSASEGFRDAINRYELHDYVLSRNEKCFMPDTSITTRHNRVGWDKDDLVSNRYCCDNSSWTIPV